ncbi:MAG TPA: trehalose-phosphatase [Acidimicrobiales bacterium]
MFVDFDGTLAPIVADPGDARPLAGVGAVLGRLARRLAVVAVVSGRPVAFVAERLGPVPGVGIYGLYGLEHLDADGAVRLDPAAAGWRPVVERTSAEARAGAPSGVGVEDKGVALTVHWRTRPDAAGWAVRFCEQAAARTGLVLQPGRMALELRPPVDADKGSVVDRLMVGMAAGTYLGDDVGDLAAFAALDRWGEGGAAVAKVAVVDAQSPGEVAAAADEVVEGPQGALALLERIADRLDGPGPA